MKDAVQTMENLCQEKLLLFQELLSVFRDEKKCIVKADIGALWEFTRKKNDLSDRIKALREEIMATAVDGGLIGGDKAPEYSLKAIIATLPSARKTTLVNLRLAINHIKRQITTLGNENRRYIEESMKTIDDLVQIIMRNSEQADCYGREHYLKRNPQRRSRMVLGEV